MTCDNGHNWQALQHDGIADERCASCGILGTRVDAGVVIRFCHKCGQSATRKLSPPSNTYLCEQHHQERIINNSPSYRRGRV